jgi:hypothetical protein
VPQLVRQRGEELPFVRIVSVRGLKAPLVDDDAVAGALASPEGVARLVLVEPLQIEHIARALARRQIHFAQYFTLQLHSKLIIVRFEFSLTFSMAVKCPVW